MTIYSEAALLAQVAERLPDNDQQEITPADVRQVLTNIVANAPAPNRRRGGPFFVRHFYNAQKSDATDSSLEGLDPALLCLNCQVHVELGAEAGTWKPIYDGTGYGRPGAWIVADGNFREGNGATVPYKWVRADSPEAAAAAVEIFAPNKLEGYYGPADESGHAQSVVRYTRQGVTDFYAALHRLETLPVPAPTGLSTDLNWKKVGSPAQLATNTVRGSHLLVEDLTALAAVELAYLALNQRATVKHNFLSGEYDPATDRSSTDYRLREDPDGPVSCYITGDPTNPYLFTGRWVKEEAASGGGSVAASAAVVPDFVTASYGGFELLDPNVPDVYGTGVRWQVGNVVSHLVYTNVLYRCIQAYHEDNQDELRYPNEHPELWEKVFEEPYVQQFGATPENPQTISFNQLYVYENVLYRSNAYVPVTLTAFDPAQFSALGGIPYRGPMEAGTLHLSGGDILYCLEDQKLYYSNVNGELPYNPASGLGIAYYTTSYKAFTEYTGLATQQWVLDRLDGGAEPSTNLAKDFVLYDYIDGFTSYDFLEELLPNLYDGARITINTPFPDLRQDTLFPSNVIIEGQNATLGLRGNWNLGNYAYVSNLGAYQYNGLAGYKSVTASNLTLKGGNWSNARLVLSGPNNVLEDVNFDGSPGAGQFLISSPSPASCTVRLRGYTKYDPVTMPVQAGITLIDERVNSGVASSGGAIDYANPVVHATSGTLSAADFGKLHLIVGNAAVTLTLPAPVQGQQLALQVHKDSTALHTLAAPNGSSFDEGRAVVAAWAGESRTFAVVGGSYTKTAGRVRAMTAKLMIQAGQWYAVPTQTVYQVPLSQVMTQEGVGLADATNARLYFPRAGEWNISFLTNVRDAAMSSYCETLAARNGVLDEWTVNGITTPALNGGTDTFAAIRVTDTRTASAGQFVSLHIYLSDDGILDNRGYVPWLLSSMSITEKSPY